MTDLAGWNSPVCMYEHAISQRRHPVQRVGVILSTLVGSAVRVAISPFLSCDALGSTVSVAPETLDELIERNRGHRHTRHAPTRAELHRDAGDGDVVGRVDDGHEVVGAEDGVLCDDPRAHALDVGVHLLDPAGPFAEHLTPGFRERAQHDVQAHATNASFTTWFRAATAETIDGHRPSRLRSISRRICAPSVLARSDVRENAAVSAVGAAALVRSKGKHS